MRLSGSVLCPIDFSDGARTAVRYACAIAAHLQAPVTALTVGDPLLHEALEMMEARPATADRAAVEEFVRDALQGQGLPACDITCEAVLGKPAPEILRVAREGGAQAIVMSSHGLSGVRKLFFGSTTERVLRETTVPVVVTPPDHGGAADLASFRAAVHRVLVPVDLSAATAAQVAVAQYLANAIGLPLLIAHVVEPVRGLPSRVHLARVDAERRARAEREIGELVASLHTAAPVEDLVAFGDPAEEIAKIARDRQAGLIVMGLHSSPLLGPRMGSVTYRVLCLARALVLALPPGYVLGLSVPVVPAPSTSL